MIDFIKDRLLEKSTWKGAASIAAAVLIKITPDKWDIIIEALLGIIGITDIFTLEKKEASAKKSN